MLPAFLWAGATATVSVATKWGRSSPLRCFALVQNQRPRETQPQCSVKLLFTEKVNGTVNRSVNRVFHAPFTFSAPEKASKPFPRISIRNGFTRPTGDINVNSPYLLRGPRERTTSRRIFVICHFSFGDRPLGGSLRHFHGVRHGCAVDLPTLQTAIEAL